LETCGGDNVPAATVAVVVAGGGTADGDCAEADVGAATLVDGADGGAVEDFVGSVGSREKSTTLINHATTTTAAVTPRPTITPRDDAIVDKATRDDDTGWLSAGGSETTVAG
jgi:hypothetical protein